MQIIRRHRGVCSLLVAATLTLIVSAVGSSVGSGIAGAEGTGRANTSTVQRHDGPIASVTLSSSTGQAATTAQIDSLTVSPNPVVVGTDVTITFQYSGGSPQSEFGSVITDLNDDFDPLNCSGTLVSGTSTDGTEQELCAVPLDAYVGLYDIQVVDFTPGPPPSVEFVGGETPFMVISPHGPELGITTSSLPSGSVWSRTNKTHYSADLLASGGNLPYKWSLASGSSPLPPGLTLHRGTGVISGKATAAGTYSFTVQAVDKRTKRTKTTPSSQHTATVILSIQIT